MTQLQDLKKLCKDRGLKGYSTLCKNDLIMLLGGKRVPKRLKRNQVSVETQTDFPPCNECGLKALMTHLIFKANSQCKIIYDGELEIDAETGEVVSWGVVDYSK